MEADGKLRLGEGGDGACWHEVSITCAEDAKDKRCVEGSSGWGSVEGLPRAGHVSRRIIYDGVMSAEDMKEKWVGHHSYSYSYS